jgi:hypothetical protein
VASQAGEARKSRASSDALRHQNFSTHHYAAREKKKKRDVGGFQYLDTKSAAMQPIIRLTEKTRRN